MHSTHLRISDARSPIRQEWMAHTETDMWRSCVTRRSLLQILAPELNAMLSHLHFRNNGRLSIRLSCLQEFSVLHYFVYLPDHQDIPCLELQSRANMRPCASTSIHAENKSSKWLISCRVGRSYSELESSAIRQALYYYMVRRKSQQNFFNCHWKLHPPACALHHLFSLCHISP